jgi:hypothetical protein
MSQSLTILTHPDWPRLRAHLRLETYSRDTNSRGEQRRRIEVVAPQNPATREWLLDVLAPCVRCGLPMHPIRSRRSTGFYYAAACPLDKNVGCSRSGEASDEYRRIVADLETAPVGPVTPSLFDEPPRRLTPHERHQAAADAGCDTWEEYRGER